MRQAFIELIELIARAVGIRAVSEAPAPAGQNLLIIAAVVAVCLLAAWGAGRLTSLNRVEGDGEMTLRGGFLLVVYGGLALIFAAGVAWSWGYLFG